jgi:hypothetical protein
MKLTNDRSLRALWHRLAREVRLFPGVRAWIGADGKTHVQVEITFAHPVRPRIPSPSLLGRRYRITTEPSPLDPQGFPSINLRDNIAKDAAKPRRRALYCWDNDRHLVLAALSFHVDKTKSIPLMVTDLAVRDDALIHRSQFAVVMLFDVLLDVAHQAAGRRDDEVGLLARPGDRAYLQTLGLSTCERPAHLSKPGTWYCFKRRRLKP